MRKAQIKFKGMLAGHLTEDELGYHFKYIKAYLESSNPVAISKTLPLKEAVFNSNILFPFFDGLIPEGWLLEIAESNWKLSARDRMGLLLACCKNCIGAVSIYPLKEEENE